MALVENAGSNSTPSSCSAYYEVPSHTNRRLERGALGAKDGRLEFSEAIRNEAAVRPKCPPSSLTKSGKDSP
jgi:hypothetical protein